MKISIKVGDPTLLDTSDYVLTLEYFGAKHHFELSDKDVAALLKDLDTARFMYTYKCNHVADNIVEQVFEEYKDIAIPCDIDAIEVVKPKLYIPPDNPKKGA